MEKIAIQLEEQSDITRINEPVGLGIPLPRGAVQTVNQLALLDGQTRISVQLTPLGHWPDGSIRWIHISFLISLASGCKKELILVKSKSPSPTDCGPIIDQTADGLVIPTSMGSVTLYPNSLFWQIDNSENAATPSVVTLTDKAGLPCTAKAETNWEITCKGPVFVAVTIKGQWLRQNKDPLARFDFEVRIFLETGLVEGELTTHNPKRACHPGGLWDLGDPGSIYFQELAVETQLPAQSSALITPQTTDKVPENFHLSDFNLYQDSSGGENWQSRNHIDCSGEVSTQFCGYRLSNPNAFLHESTRANPLAHIEYDYGQLGVAVPDFWQNFPTSLRKDKNTLTIGLFPKDAKNPYELQGGEQKTLRFLMAYNSNNSVAATAYSPLVPVLNPECYEQSAAFPWFKANTQPEALDELIAEGLNGNSDFFEKREVIDEFGWRNFGDLFADHETLYQAAGEPPFISHYNNQYDPIYGFARQFALTGDKRWFQLMDDLARHVVDIDIYHTAEDRTEYNNGLFWHTDHYLNAHTATHRTFSRHNDTSSTPGQTGGGPAEEHCYSTGLLYHYYMTGNEKSRQSVLDLARWITGLYEGRGGFFEQILAFKKREIPALKKMVRGDHVSTHRYPFKRGTGNYINTLLDAWLLEEDRTWLKQVEMVIRKTIHPADSIEHRNLLDIESGWSYLILLTSLFRYLYLKRQMDSEDDQYEYTEKSLLRYTRWMLKNEHPFLADEAQLEFANDTWVAQDIRKAMLMFQASELDPENSEQYQSQGRKWLEEITRTLQHSQERHFTRILIILMQNYGPHSLEPSKSLAKNRATSAHQHWDLPILTWRLLLYRIGRRVLRALVTFRPSRERLWLNTRLNRS